MSSLTKNRVDVYARAQEVTSHCGLEGNATWGVHTIRRVLRRFDLDQRRVYRDAKGRYYGLSAQRTHEIISQPDLLLDLSGATWFEESERIPQRVFIDRDPGLTQFGSAKDPKMVTQ